MSDLPLPRIIAALCTGCERCVEICPTAALGQVGGKAVLVEPHRCTYCALCEDLCPDGAIALPFLIVFADSQVNDNP
jgi:hydrogenase-4 component H